MREIELKFQVKDLKDILATLTKLDCKISEPITQNDSIFVEDLNNTESVENSVWLRIRQTNNEVELNYKKQSALKMESEEIEFGVTSYDKANAFLSALGFHKWVEVKKVRRYSQYKDCNICLDSVERLGDFVELELLIPEKENIDYEAKLMAYAQELNIDITKRINSHYDTMISELPD